MVWCGIGKTETVKDLGHALGRYALYRYREKFMKVYVNLVHLVVVFWWARVKEFYFPGDKNEYHVCEDFKIFFFPSWILISFGVGKVMICVICVL